MREYNMAKHNRWYKDSVFVDLFSEDKTAKENFLSLYNALHGTSLDTSTKLKPLKLEQAMYTKLSNDVSCLIDNKIIVLAEHQSTINENMPCQGMSVRGHSLTASFEQGAQNIAAVWNHRPPWRY